MTALIVVLWIVVLIIAPIVAGNKGRSQGGWFLACLLLSPLAILILFALPSLKPQPAPVVEAQGGATKVCPQCAETVKAAARICRFCRYQFHAEPVSTVDQQLVRDLLGRWRELEVPRRTQMACDLLSRLEPGFAPDRDAQGDSALRDRLEALLVGRDANAPNAANVSDEALSSPKYEQPVIDEKKGQRSSMREWLIALGVVAAIIVFIWAVASHRGGNPIRHASVPSH